MEPYTPDESLTYAALEFERTVLQTDRSAIACGVGVVRMQVAQQGTRLAVVRCGRAANCLELSILSAPLVSLEVSLPEPLFCCLQVLLDVNPKESMASPPLCGIDSLFAHAVALYLNQAEGA